MSNPASQQQQQQQPPQQQAPQQQQPQQQQQQQPAASDIKLPVEAIIKNITGYTQKIDTPFGEVCTIYADNYSCGKPLKAIEDIIDKKIRPLVTHINNSSLYNSQYTQQVSQYAENSILDFFGTSTSLHTVIGCGFREPGIHQQITKLLKLNSFSQSATLKQKEQLRPCIYIPNVENYYNVTPWLMCGAKLEPLATDKEGNIVIDKFVKIASKNYESPLQVMSISAISPATFSKINVKKIGETVAGLKEELKQLQNKQQQQPQTPQSQQQTKQEDTQQQQKLIFFVLDISQLCQKQRISITKEYGFVDFFIINAASFMGSCQGEAENILIASKSALKECLKITSILPQDKFVGLELATSSSSSATNPIPIYRTALCLEFLKQMGIDNIKKKEKKNLDFFTQGLQKVNDDIQNKQSKSQVSVSYTDNSVLATFMLNFFVEESQSFDDMSRPYIQPKFAAQLLHDLFGIQVSYRENYLLKSSGLKIINVQENININGLLGDDVQQKQSCILMDIFFTLQEAEITYILQALKAVALTGIKVLPFYDMKSKICTPIDFVMPVYDFPFEVMVKFQASDYGDKRIDKYNEQLDDAKRLLLNPSQFFQVSGQYSEERSVIHKKNAVPPEQVQLRKRLQKQNNNEENAINIAAQLDAEAVQQVRKLIRQTTLSEIDENKRREQQQQQQQQQQNEGKEDWNDKEKRMMDVVLEILRKEMQEKDKQREIEDRVFNQLKDPNSGQQKIELFSSNFSLREKRNKNLREIFQVYANMRFKEEEQKGDKAQDKDDKQEKKEKKKAPVLNNKKAEKIVRNSLIMNQWMKFCDDFELINENVDPKTLSKLFVKTATNFKDLFFNEFLILLEKIAIMYYYNDNSLITSFDKVEALYKFMGIDDSNIYKHKIKDEDVSGYSASLHEKYNRRKIQNKRKNSANSKGDEASSSTINQGQKFLEGEIDWDAANDNYSDLNPSNLFMDNQRGVRFNPNNTRNTQKSMVSKSTVIQGNKSPNDAIANKNNPSFSEFSVEKAKHSQSPKNNDKHHKQPSQQQIQVPGKKERSTDEKRSNLESKHSEEKEDKQGGGGKRKRNIMNRAKQIEQSEKAKEQELLEFFDNKLGNSNVKSQKKLK